MPMGLLKDQYAFRPTGSTCCAMVDFIHHCTLMLENHGLRGSASPVLTVTGFVNERWQFLTPHRINTP